MKERFCSTCGETLRAGSPSVRCSLCLCNYHAYCWEKTGGCTTPNCPGNLARPGAEAKRGYKKCSYCGEKVVDFASRCRYCRNALDVPLEELKARPGLRGARTEKIKAVRKDPILTALLNLVFPGAGYMYLGEFTRGLLWFGIAVAAWFFTRGLGLLAVYAWVIYDSSRLAIRQNKEHKEKLKRTERF